MSVKEVKSSKISRASRLFLWFEERFPRVKNPAFQRWFMLVSLSIFLGSLLSPNLLKEDIKYQTGDIAERDIKASSSFSVEDYFPTEKKRADAAQKALPVYDLDTSIPEDLTRRVNAAFSLMRGRSGTSDQKKEEFERVLGLAEMPGHVFRRMEKAKFSVDQEKAVTELLSSILTNGVIAEKAGLPDTGILIRKTSGGEKRIETDKVIDLKQARKLIPESAHLLSGKLNYSERRAAAFIVQKLIEPNLNFNAKETEAGRVRARADISPVFLQIKKGEMIVREGERIQESHLAKLRAQHKAARDVNALPNILGSALLTGLILKTLYDSSLKRVKTFISNNKNLLFLCALLAFVVVAAKISFFVVKAVSARMPYLDPDILVYALPVSSGAMLVSVFFAPEVAIIFSVPTAMLASFLFGESLQFFVYFLIAGIIAVRNMSTYKERGDILKAGIMVGLAQALLIIAFSLSTGSFFSINALEKVVVAFVGGALLGVFVIGLVPIVEIAFGYTTNFKLLELASLDHPLMQELIVQAPGTYHHSVIVGSMVEAAARAIGANPLLAKVSAYYHDVGKSKKPAYFIENQMGMENKHEKLAPSMSSLILTSHVKEGVELARRHRLGPEIINVIRQHHGTSLISYFYEKARSMQDPASPPHIEDFRYPGPIPQTKEAGLVMLADSVEAASRTLNDPNPARLKGMVQKIINNIFADGQLNDCELTLKDMHQIAKSFTLILGGIFHQRIEYPESAAKGNGAKKADADSDQQQTKSDKDRTAKDKEKSEETLRRLGSV